MVNLSGEKPYLLGNLVKSVVFGLLGIAAVGGTFFAEMNVEELALSTNVTGISEFQFDGGNIIPNDGVVRFDSSKTGAMEVLLNNPNLQEYIFHLNTGRIWGNFTISDANVNILVDQAVVIPNRASFDLNFDGDSMELSVYEGDVYLAFLEDGLALSEFSDEYSPVYMNRFLVPRDAKVTVSLSKIDERLKQLLYSKLVKEFKFAAISDDERHSGWVVNNMNEDEKFLELKKQNYLSEVIGRGVKVDKTLWKDFVFWSESNLTFIPEKKDMIVLDQVFDHLDDAIYFLNEGDQESSDLSWAAFEVMLADLPQGVVMGHQFIDRFDSYVKDLMVFEPGDKLYPILLRLLDNKFLNNRDAFEVVNELWLDVYAGVDLNQAAAEETLNKYYRTFEQSLNRVPDLKFKENYLSFQNQLFDNLLLRYPLFYKDKYFAIKGSLEEQLLRLYEDGQLKTELEQSFVANKISFIKRLRKFFFDGEVSVDEARTILSRLIEESEEALQKSQSELAILQFFESQLDDIGNFWGYLNSPEYYSSSVYGLTHQDRFDTYVEETEQIWSFIDIQRDLFGEDEETEVDLDAVRKELALVFDKYPEVSGVQLGELEDVGQRYVKISGVVGGYPFEAEFDRANESLSEVYAYDELVSDRAVKLGSLLPLLDNKFAELAEEIEGEELTVESNAQRIARIFIANKIAEVGFEVAEEDVELLDEDEAKYRVTEIVNKEFSGIVFTFDYDATKEMATNLFMTVNGAPVVLGGEFSLETLRDIAEAEGDVSEFTGDQDEEVLEGDGDNQSTAVRR